MARAFLSHSSNDKGLVRKIAKKLGAQNCILDEISFEPGAKTLDEIFAGLEISDVFVLFLSDASLSSDWVQKEIGMAWKNLSNDKLSRILAFIIDENITYKDSRIPEWLSKDYNLRYLSNEVMIYHKIKNALREINFMQNPLNREIESTFVGRNDEMARFEKDILNIDNWIPTYIVAYNYYEGIGRTTFLKNALMKQNFIQKKTTPIILPFDSKESIESFIIKLNAISEDDSVFRADLSSKTMDEKIETAIALVKEFSKSKEIIFIRDNGGIVLPNKEIAPWFRKIVEDPIFENNLTFCLITKFRPNEMKMLEERRALSYMIPELSSPETQSLFLKLLQIYKHADISKEDKQFFLKHLKGIPNQIIYAVKMIDINLPEAKRSIDSIDQMVNKYSRILLDKLRESSLAYQIAIMLSKSEIFSKTLIYKVFGENTETDDAVQLLLDFSAINYLFGGYEYLSLNAALRDYINRARIQLEGKYATRLSEVIKKLLRKDLDQVLMNDYAEFMVTLQNMLEENKKIPSKYFMPSLLLKEVIMLYNRGAYQRVIEICNRLLNEGNYDEQIVWETRYLQTTALCKIKDSRALENLQYFKEDSISYNFLKGFYYRNIGEKVKALDAYYKVLKKDPDHHRSKREIVIVLLSQGKYAEAYDMAKENYEKKDTNIHHIRSYFMALIRRNEYLSPADIRVLDELIENVESSVDAKAADFARCMKGEYAYYVKKNLGEATRILMEAAELNENKIYPKKSLYEIYRSAKRLTEYADLGITDIAEHYDVEDLE